MHMSNIKHVLSTYTIIIRSFMLEVTLRNSYIPHATCVVIHIVYLSVFPFYLRNRDNLIAHFYSCHLAAKHNALVSFSIIENISSLQSQQLIFSTLPVSTQLEVWSAQVGSNLPWLRVFHEKQKIYLKSKTAEGKPF